MGSPREYLDSEKRTDDRTVGSCDISEMDRK